METLYFRGEVLTGMKRVTVWSFRLLIVESRSLLATQMVSLLQAFRVERLRWGILECLADSWEATIVGTTFGKLRVFVIAYRLIFLFLLLDSSLEIDYPIHLVKYEVVLL